MNESTKKLGDRYRIDDTIYGGQSIVYRAFDHKLNRTVAIKTPNESVQGNPRRLERFIEEGRKLSAVSHRNILRVFHFYEKGEIDDRYHLVTEWIDGTLSDALENQNLELNEAVAIIRKLLAGLGAIHASGIIHRDIKPANVFVSKDFQQVKIGDLGIASDPGRDETLQATPKFVAPENYRPDATVDSRSDIYSLGILACEMFLGRDDFEIAFSDIYSAGTEKTRNARWLNWHLDSSRSAPAIVDVRPDLPAQLSDIVARMMVKDPERRYATVDAVMHDLDAFSSGAGDLSSAEPLPLPIDDLSDDKPNWLLTPTGLITLSVVLLVGTALAVVFWPKPTSDRDNALALRESMLAAREEAIRAGAEDDPVIQDFSKGEEFYATAVSAFEDGRYPEVLTQVNDATRAYTAAESEAWLRQVSLSSSMADRFGISVEQADYKQGLTQLAAAHELLDSGQQSDASDTLELALASVKQALRVSPRQYRVGSSEDEIRSAVELCQTVLSQCEENWYSTELQRTVSIAPFDIDKYEITNREFKAFVDATGLETVAESAGFSYAWDGTKSAKMPGYSWRSPDGEIKALDDAVDGPVVHIGFADANAYCEWANARLPTEAEWEYAARGIGRYQFPWGNTWDSSKLLYSANSTLSGANIEVGSYAPAESWSGGYDFAGSVWEWVTDSDSGEGVLKGGSYLESNPANFRLASRRVNPPDRAHSDDGFRCARTTETW